MLVLSRKEGERVWIGEEVAVTVVRIGGGKVRLGFEAPAGVKILREELENSPVPSVFTAETQAAGMTGQDFLDRWRE